MKKLLITVIMFLGLIPMTTATSFALNKPTHKLINKFIATHSLMGFSLDSYLKVQLGLQSGIATSFDNKKPVDLLGDGGESEDEPMYFRSVNHFHNPITKQGFSDLNHWWALWGFFGLLNGKSSIQWSLLENSQSPGGHYSWPDARNYFYKALTPTDQTTRDQNFADTFRALGQVMHLVEDLSVPEHTRNELHGQSWKYGYENWVEENVKDLSGIVPIFFDPSALGNKNPLVASAPIINLFDNNQYHGNNPDVTLESNIGLSEYTNANFVTQDTAFAPGFNYPDLGSIVEYPEIKDGYARTYLRKLGKVDGQGGNGEHIEHLAVAGWLYKRLPTDQKKLALRPVFDDYAPKLIPRAVGYAAQLMSYFFRGQIDVADSQLTGTSATFKVINNTPNESMGPGALVIAYEYNGNYGVSSEVQMGEIIAPGSESANDYTVTFSQSIPSDADIKYRLVFKGKLGNEDNAVVAKLAWSSANGTFGCVGSSGGGTPFYVPPLQSEGGSFTVSGQACCADWGIYDYTIDCSYTSGYMDCYFRPYFIDPNWNGGMPVLCAIDRCEGSWDGYNFYSVCTLEQQGSGICYQKAECTPIYMKIETGMEPSGSAANGNAASIAPSSSTTNANCGSMLKLK